MKTFWYFWQAIAICAIILLLLHTGGTLYSEMSQGLPRLLAAK